MTPALRPYRDGDAPALFAVFVEAVRTGAATRYTEAQRLAWAPRTEMPADWPAFLAGMDIWIAEIDGAIAGFFAATPKGYIDLAFVRPEWMGRGVAQALYDHILGKARQRTLPRLSVHASHLERSFFARNGWQVDHPETVTRGGQSLERFAMSLQLEPTP